MVSNGPKSRVRELSKEALADPRLGLGEAGYWSEADDAILMKVDENFKRYR